MVVSEIQREEQKVKKSIKDAAKRGDISSAKQLAKEIVRSRKAVSRLHTSKAQMNSVVMQMQNQYSACFTPKFLSRGGVIVGLASGRFGTKETDIYHPFPVMLPTRLPTTDPKQNVTERGRNLM